MSDLFPNAVEYLQAGMTLFPLHPIVQGKCRCENPDCEAAGKHPLRKNWQHQERESEATVKEVWIDVYECNSFGWKLDDDHIIIDVDPRNGGEKSLIDIQTDLNIDLFNLCTAIVKTGGGGYHFYFKKDNSRVLGWKLPEKYRGIDIKQAGGFVVIAGSLHSSGKDYEWFSAKKSDLEELAPLPESIASMLDKVRTEHHKEMQAAGMGDVIQIADMLEWIKNEDSDYEEWLRVGMAVHHATAGSYEGLALFHKWGAKSSKYSSEDTDRRWHSFGKRTNNLSTMGTLNYMAKEAGWRPMDYELTPEELEDVKQRWAKKVESRQHVPSIDDDSDIDLFAPPGLLGRINDYVYACSVFPNRNLTLACSLSVLTNVIGRKYYWPGRFSNIQPNLLVLCIAGSSVGKDSVLGAAHKLLSAVNLQSVVHGRIKSDKDLLDALERSQYAMYFNDEFGYFLQRLNNAMRKGNASYLEGIIGTIMEVFTKGDKTVLLDISRKTEIQERYNELANKAAANMQEGPKGMDPALQKRKMERAKDLAARFAGGLPNPFLSMFTTATPRTMELAFSGESTENGFLSRALTFYEYETNPRPKPDFEGAPAVPLGLAMALKSIAFDRDECPFGRVDSFDQQMIPIRIDSDAQVYVDQAINYFFEMAEVQKESGLESLPRRALDSVVKVCIALAAEERHLTLPMARYAVKLVRKEMSKKIRRVNSTEGMESTDKEEKMDAVGHKICEVCDTADGELIATIMRRCKTSKITPASVAGIVDGLVSAGYLEKIDTGRKYADKPVYRYKSTQKCSA